MECIKANDYNIYFNDNGYDEVNKVIEEEHYSNIYVIVDSNSNEHCLPPFLSYLTTEISIEIIEFDPGEEYKTIETCFQIWNALTELGADRKSLIINLGGGVITDLGGFVAATFKRGIDFINVPTTLLAMVDASIGGKNGIDLGNLKNQIGVIAQPKMVLIDTLFLETLPQNEMRSGLAEMLKHGLIFDDMYWNQFLDLEKIDYADFDILIHKSIEIKNKIVLQDPKENGIRKALNFGHTLGHAIESYFLENDDKTNLLHGEAVAAGMILESHIAWRKNLISTEEFVQIKSTIKNIFDDIVFEDADIEKIIKLLIHDKKNEYGKVQFSLIEKIGQPIINQQVEEELIIKAFKDYKS